jgi:hypothetical protein
VEAGVVEDITEFCSGIGGGSYRSGSGVGGGNYIGGSGWGGGH